MKFEEQGGKKWWDDIDLLYLIKDYFHARGVHDYFM